MVTDGVLLDALGGCAFGERSQRDKPGLGHVGGQADWETRQLRGDVKRMPRVFKTRLGATDAGITGARTRPVPVPQPRIAVGVRLGAFAAHVLHGTAQVGWFLGTGLV